MTRICKFMIIINILILLNLIQLKMGMYKDGKEVMFLIFNTTGQSRSNFFNVSNIIQSSFTDLSQVQIMSIKG